MANLLDLPTLDDTTIFDEVWVAFYDRRGYILAIAAVNAGEVVAGVPRVDNRPDNASPVDDGHDAYNIARDAVVSGDARLKYYMSGRTATADSQYAYAKADVPPRYRHQLLWDTFNIEVQSAAAQSMNVAYQELTFYQYNDASNIPAPYPTYTNGDLDTLIDSMEDAGWYLSGSEANTNKGTNTDLRLAIVSYEYIGATDTSTVNVNVLPDSDIRYSIDYGQTWTEVAPLNPDDITNLEITIGSETVDFLIKPQTQLVNPVERIINDVHPPYYYGYSTPYSASLASSALSDFFGLQFRHWKGAAWGNASEPDYGGITPVIPIDEIRITPPHLIGQHVLPGHDDLIEGNDGYYLMIITKETGQNRGEIQLVQVDSDNLLDYSDTRYTTFLCCFESYPNSEIYHAANGFTTTFTVRGTKRGVSVGDTMFIEDEQMRVTAVGATFKDSNGVFHTIDVTRGINGTTAGAYGFDTRIRGVINSDRIRNLSFLAERGLLRPHIIRILGYKRPKELV